MIFFLMIVLLLMMLSLCMGVRSATVIVTAAHIYNILIRGANKINNTHRYNGLMDSVPYKHELSFAQSQEKQITIVFFGNKSNYP